MIEDDYFGTACVGLEWVGDLEHTNGNANTLDALIPCQYLQLYSEIRDMNFSYVGNLLSRRTKNLSREYEGEWQEPVHLPLLSPNHLPAPPVESVYSTAAALQH